MDKEGNGALRGVLYWSTFVAWEPKKTDTAASPSWIKSFAGIVSNSSHTSEAAKEGHEFTSPGTKKRRRFSSDFSHREKSLFRARVCQIYSFFVLRGDQRSPDVAKLIPSVEAQWEDNKQTSATDYVSPVI